MYKCHMRSASMNVYIYIYSSNAIVITCIFMYDLLLSCSCTCACAAGSVRYFSGRPIRPKHAEERAPDEPDSFNTSTRSIPAVEIVEASGPNSARGLNGSGAISPLRRRDNEAEAAEAAAAAEIEGQALECESVRTLVICICINDTPSNVSPCYNRETVFKYLSFFIVVLRGLHLGLFAESHISFQFPLTLVSSFLYSTV